MIYPNNITFSEDDFKPAGYDIFHDIKDKIINGELSPGDHLPGERSLMEVYHRSRATVREALHLLERAGFIRIIPRSRPIVLDYTGFGIEKPLGEAIEAKHITLPEIREFRTVVEGEMAAWAASSLSSSSFISYSLQPLYIIASKASRA